MENNRQSVNSEQTIVDTKWKICCATLALLCMGDVFAERTPTLDEIKKDIQQLKENDKILFSEIQKLKDQGDKLKDQGDKLKDQNRRKMTEDEYNRLMKAVEKDDLKKVNSFMNKGLDLNTSYPGVHSNMSVLEIASLRNNISIVKLLIDNGADVNFAKSFSTPLRSALEKRNEDIVALLLEKGADPNLGDKYPLIDMIDDISYKLLDKNSAGEIKKIMRIIDLLVEHGARIDAKDKKGNIPLIYAIKKCYENDIVLELLNLFCNRVMKEENENDIVKDLIFLGKYKKRVSDEYIKGKVGYNLNLNVQNEEGETALMYALTLEGISLKRLIKIMELLLSKGANPNIEDKRGRTALMYALTLKLVDSETHIKIVELLLSKGANPNIEDKYGNTVLDYAKKAEHFDKLVPLIEKAIEDDKSGKTTSVSDSEAEND